MQWDIVHYHCNIGIHPINYSYTLEGYLKAVNQPELINNYDPGKDGINKVDVVINSTDHSGGINTLTIGAVSLLTQAVPWNIEGELSTANNLVSAINSQYAPGSYEYTIQK